MTMSKIKEYIQNTINNNGLKNTFKGTFVLVVVLLLFFTVSLVVNINAKHESAYNVLSKLNSKNNTVMLQDTRVHNWSELDKDNH